MKTILFKNEIVKELLEKGMTEDQFDSWIGDLYVLKTDISEAFVKDYKWRGNVTLFTSPIDGQKWYDIPFAVERHAPWDRLQNVSVVQLPQKGVATFKNRVILSDKELVHEKDTESYFNFIYRNMAKEMASAIIKTPGMPVRMVKGRGVENQSTTHTLTVSIIDPDFLDLLLQYREQCLKEGFELEGDKWPREVPEVVDYFARKYHIGG